MHYLAHFYLSGNSSGIILGNFIGELKTIKGPSMYAEDIQSGIDLHHEIDLFTHNHPIVARSRKRLNPKFLKYSSAIIDTFYDHFLALNWNDYHDVPLDEFAISRYHVLIDNQYVLPYKAKRMLQQMIVENWLMKYKTLAGLNEAKLKELALIKSPIGTQIANAMFDLTDNYSEFKNDFNEFFPQLINFVKMTHLKNRGKSIELEHQVQRKLIA